MTPHSHVWRLNGLDQHVFEWPQDDAGAATVVLVHGLQDSAATWDDVALGLAEAGLRVLAPDMRGFGDGPRAPAGSYYYFPDYVADLAALLAAQTDTSRAPLLLVGHSMGASIVTYFTGAFPEKVTKLALIDGVGPPDVAPSVAPDRMRRWIEGSEAARAAGRRPMTEEEALRRLRRFNPLVQEEVLARKVQQASRLADGAAAGDDALVWKSDPLHATTSPLFFSAETYMAFASRVTCPTLYVSGGTMGFHVADEADRLACFRHLTRLTLEGGHSLHWTMPSELTQALLDFCKT